MLAPILFRIAVMLARVRCLIAIANGLQVRVMNMDESTLSDLFQQ
jgi:hypothetical protein